MKLEPAADDAQVAKFIREAGGGPLQDVEEATKRARENVFGSKATAKQVSKLEDDLKKAKEANDELRALLEKYQKSTQGASAVNAPPVWATVGVRIQVRLTIRFAVSTSSFIKRRFVRLPLCIGRGWRTLEMRKRYATLGALRRIVRICALVAQCQT